MHHIDIDLCGDFHGCVHGKKRNANVNGIHLEAGDIFCNGAAAAFIYFAKLADETRLLIRPEDYRNDISLKGEFVRRVMASSLTETEKERIIACGFRALSGEEIGI